MENQLNISEELRSLSIAVAEIERKNTYTVPEDYFTILPQQILMLVQDDPMLFFPASNVFSVPSGYFETLSDSVLEKIRSEESAETEIKTLSPLLASLRNKETYTVPAGFFNNNTFIAPEKEETKVVQMQPRKTRWSRYAVAATVAVILGTTAFFTFNKTDANADNIASTSTDSVTPLEQKVSAVSDDELQDYLFETTDYPLLSTEGEPEVESALSNIKEEDIKDYLKENSAPNEDALKGI